MQPSTYQALLVIADISGFTQFMKPHQQAGCHAKQLVVELLKAVISAATPPLELAEIEGDAVFFYAVRRDHENGELTPELTAIKVQVMSFFRSFYQTLHRLCALNPCACEACAIAAKNLRLKVIIHAGEVTIEQIHSFDKLFGMDVILVHRLLKNSVPSHEYVLMTESAYNWLEGFYQLEPERQTEYCEGIGEVETVVFYMKTETIYNERKDIMSTTLAETKSVSKPRHRNALLSIAFNLFQKCQMRFAALILILSMIFTSSSEAQYASSQPADWCGSLGGVLIAFPKYPGSDEYQAFPLPLLSVEYKERIFLNPPSSGAQLTLGAYVVRTPNWTWAVTMGITDSRLESRGDALAGMGDRGIGLNTGSSVSFRRGMFQTSGVVTLGLNDNQGWTGTLSAGLGGRLGDQWFANLDGNATFADTDQMQYHFGIDASQALRRHALIAERDPRLGPSDGGPYSVDAGLQSLGLSGKPWVCPIKPLDSARISLGEPAVR